MKIVIVCFILPYIFSMQPLEQSAGRKRGHVHIDDLSVVDQEIEKEFPRRSALIYACRLVGEERLHRESIDGLEIARETFFAEIKAREKYENSEVLQKRLAGFRAAHKIADREYEELFNTNAEEHLRTIARHKVNTYYAALNPSYGITHITEALRFHNGDDFNDDIESYFPPEDPPEDPYEYS